MKEKISDEFCDVVIPAYIISLKDESERLHHILAEFHGKNEFSVKIIDSIKHEHKDIQLWNNIVTIAKMAIENDDDVIILVQDDHLFTDSYTKDYLLKNILDANDCNALILSGGNGGFDNVVPLNENRYWVDTLMSIQFLVLYKGLFKKIVKYKFKDDDTADGVLSGITSHKMLLFPFISKKKDFAAHIHNHTQKTVSEAFDDAQKRLSCIQNAYIKYVKTPGILT